MVRRMSDENYWKLRVGLCWIKWALIVAVVSLIVAGLIFISVVITLYGHTPIEGDTYSTPGGNAVFLLVVIGLVLCARYSSKKKRSLDNSSGTNESRTCGSET